MNTKHFILLLIVSLALNTICSSQNNPKDNKIDNVENGLIDARMISFDTQVILNKKIIDTLPTFNIYDRMQRYNVPGVSIAVIKNYNVDWAKGYGIMEVGTNKPVSTKSLFQAASCSKPLAVVIVMKLVETGKLNLDEDVNKYLKIWKIPYDSVNTKITLRQLITHNAGINRPGNGIDYLENSSPTLIQVFNGESPAINDPFHFDFPPGTVFKYSNLGYMIIQKILEDQLNMSYSQIVRKYIFEPLKMNSSWMQFPLPENEMAFLSKPHNKSGEPQDYGLHPTALAHGGLIATPTDLSKFIIDLMLLEKNKSGKILKPESVNKMFTKIADVDPQEFSGFSELGFGIFLLGQGDHTYFAHPGGNNTGASCAFIGSINTGNGIVVMTNGILGLYLTMEIVASIAKEYSWEY